MAGNGQTEKLEIRIDSNAAKTAKEDAGELENLQKRFEGATGALKQHEAALRRLQQGGVVNIQTARELKTKIEAEKNEIAALTEKVTAAGSSFEKLSQQTKINEDRTREANKATAAWADALGGGLVAAILAVEAAGIGATYALARFVVESGNLARSQNLARAAVTGSEEDAKRLGTQVDALSLKIPTLRGKVNDLAIDMRRGGLGGQTLVDTLNASAQAAAALDDAAGAKVRELVDRGKTTGRFSLNALETRGTGLPQFQDVAAALAKNMHTSIADAQSALLEGRVALGDGAKALRDAVEKKFAGLNLAKMLDIDVMKEKLHELFQSLTKDVNIEPLLNALKDFFSLFDQSTEAGAALHKLMTVFGDGFITVASKSLPFLKGFFEGLIIAALDLYIAVLKLQLRFQDTFGDVDLFKNIGALSTGIEAAKIAVIAFAVVAGALAVTLLLALSPLIILAVIIGAIGFAIYELLDALDDGQKALYGFGEKAIKALGNTDTWRNIGADMVSGLLDPLLAFARKGEDIGNQFKAGFKKALGIASPSKVFEEYGQFTSEGFGRGVEKGTPAVADQLDAMATPKSSSTGSSSGAQVTIAAGAVQITIQVQSAADARALAQDQNFMDQLTRAGERVALSIGQKVAA